MADNILKEFETKIDEFTLIPSGGGVFEVIVGDDLVYSKKQTGRHTDYDEVGPLVREAIS